MKKRYFVNGVAALSTLLIAGNATAVSLDAGTTALVYASENTQPAELAGPITADLGKNQLLTSNPYTRLTCDGKFITSDYALSLSGAGGGVGFTAPVAATGLNGSKVVYGPITLAAAAALDDTFSFSRTAAGYLQFAVGADASCTYELFDTGTHWAQENPSVTTTGPVVKFSPALLVRAADPSCTGTLGCGDNGYAKVDLASGGLKFEKGKTIGMVAAVNLNAKALLVSAQVSGIGGATTTWAKMVDTSSTSTNMTVTGDFSAMKKVWFEPAGGVACSGYATTREGVLSADKKSVKFDNNVLKTAAGSTVTLTSATVGGSVCVEVDGTTVIETGDYSAVVNLERNTDFNVPSTIELPMVGRVKDNGSTDSLQLVLAPGGSYAGFIRINHMKSLAGEISMHLYNDNGDRVIIDLGDVEGQASSHLAGNSSTTQMKVSDIYAAAQAKDAAFTVTGDGKLRILVKSTATADSVNASMYSLSKDGNSFALIQE